MVAETWQPGDSFCGGGRYDRRGNLGTELLGGTLFIKWGGVAGALPCGNWHVAKPFGRNPLAPFDPGI
jgi:hypothetical protein